MAFPLKYPRPSGSKPCNALQALIHSRMRKRMQNMILELGQAKAGTREVLATLNTK